MHVYGDRNQYFKLATLLDPPGPDPVPGRAALTTACWASRRSSSWARARRRRCRRSARPTTCWSRTSTSRRPRGRTARSPTSPRTSPCLPERPGGGAQDDPGQRPARVRRLRVPPEHLRSGRDAPIRDPTARWCGPGPVLLDGALDGQPQGFMTIPGSDVGLLARARRRIASGTAVLALTGHQPERHGRSTDIAVPAMAWAWADQPRRPRPAATRSPGRMPAPTRAWSSSATRARASIWVAYLCLISGPGDDLLLPAPPLLGAAGDGAPAGGDAGRSIRGCRREFESLVDAITARTGRGARDARGAGGA